MNIALLLPEVDRDNDMAQEIGGALAHVGHDVSRPIDLAGATISAGIQPMGALMVSRELVALQWYLKAMTLGYRLAAPPVHTLALLDHPLHWRRVLERVGVPLGGCLVLEAAQDPRRDPKVSVLGFPLLVSPLPPFEGISPRQAWDRDELWNVVTEIRKRSQNLLLVREPSGIVMTWFTGTGNRPIPVSQTDLDEQRQKLSRDLVLHTSSLMELRGPCRIDLVWEQDRLFLHTISHITDLSSEGAAFRAKGGDYASFIGGIVEQAFGTKK